MHSIANASALRYHATLIIDQLIISQSLIQKKLKQRAIQKSLSQEKEKQNSKKFLESRHETGPKQKKGEDRMSNRTIGRTTREQIERWNQMTALRFQTGRRHQKSLSLPVPDVGVMVARCYCTFRVGLTVPAVGVMVARVLYCTV